MHTIDELREMIRRELEKKEYAGEPRSLYDPIIYMLEDGGKRLRPLLALLAYNLYRDDVEKALKPAIGIEIFHNYTLLHDDVMDNARLRRGRLTVHKKWNRNVAILSGDAAAITAYRYIEYCDDRYLRRGIDGFNQVAMDVCRGQQYDMEFETRDDVSEEEYLKMIHLKTSVLIAGSLRHGALIAGAPEEDCAALYELGGFLGQAFQLQDDYLDVYGDVNEFGKSIGGDIVTNKKSYLLVKALELARAEKGKTWQELTRWLATKDCEPKKKIRAVTALYDRLNVGELTQQKISDYIRESRESLDRLSVKEEFKEVFREVVRELTERKK
ncbi:MAG: polyprenyl synthetase family protein [Odoribacteraceae bacterium]|jgi:geranylgeranyl diphosphate synthase type II|nr:polyprenyl synthetase family protein [Odoribacteraceae bacterium]